MDDTNSESQNGEAYLHAILNTVVDGIITINSSGIIQAFNRAAEHIFDYTAKETIGQNVNILMPEPHKSAHDGYLDKFLTTGKASIIGSKAQELEAQRKNGDIFPIELGISEVKVNKDHFFVGIVRDITDRKRIESKQEELIEELKRSNQELDDFAYIASHDLKEPIRGLFNNALFLQEDYQGRLDKQGIKRLSRMSFLCKRMEKLIDNLLCFSRIGRQEFAIQNTDINSMVQDVINTIESYDDTVEIKVSPSLPNIVCDHTRITEVFRNLISNSIKYNTSDKKMIKIGHHKNFNNIDNVFYVQDNGIGIASEFHNDIFKIFKRLNVEDDNVKGSGVGLTLVKKIIERHQGKIWLESVSGLGTTFYFTLAGENGE